VYSAAPFCPCVVSFSEVHEHDTHPHGILVRHARFPRDMLATSSRRCHEDATYTMPRNLVKDIGPYIKLKTYVIHIAEIVVHIVRLYCRLWVCHSLDYKESCYYYYTATTRKLLPWNFSLGDGRSAMPHGGPRLTASVYCVRHDVVRDHCQLSYVDRNEKHVPWKMILDHVRRMRSALRHDTVQNVLRGTPKKKTVCVTVWLRLNILRKIVTKRRRS